MTLPLDPLVAARLSDLDARHPAEPEPGSASEWDAMLAFFAPLPGYAAPEADVHDAEATGANGPVHVRVYRPLGRDAAPLGLVWCHGGAFVGGGLDMPEADVVARELVARTGGVVVSVDYRLCVDGVHFPVPHDDVHAAFLWAASPSGPLGAGATWSIGGGSAGGNLAAGVSQRLRDEARPPAGLVLAYPVLHAQTPPATPELRALLASLPPFLRIDPDAGSRLNADLLGDLPATTPYAFPGDGRVEGLPPTLLILCECDGLLPSGQAFARQLTAAGVRAEVELVPGMIHGHLNTPGMPAALGSIARMAEFLLETHPVATTAAGSATALITALAGGDLAGVRGLFAGPAEIDDPFHGRHVDGGFEAMVRDWQPARLAKITGIEPTHCTTQGTKSAAEITLHLLRGETPVDLCVVVVSDATDDGRLVASRLYYRRARVDGRQHHRRPILDPRPLPELNPVLAEYQRSLGAGDVEGMIATFGPGFHLDGHGESQDMSEGIGMGRYDLDEISAALRQMFALNSAGATTLEKLNVIDDGTTTVVEFNLYQGVPEDQTPRNHAGVAAYERGPDGLLVEARIYDEAW